MRRNGDYMKIGILYDDVGKIGLDCSRPDKGNPGIGGTQFCFLMLIHYLSKLYPNCDIRVYRSVVHSSAMPGEHNVEYIKATSIKNCLDFAWNDKVDVFLFNFSHTLELAPLLEQKPLKSVVWVHNWIRGDILNALSDTASIKRVVFLGREHYDRYIDHRIIHKAVILPNMFNIKDYGIRDKCINNTVTYVGALVPSKGFHVLAKVWKEILHEVPDATLTVLGAGNLYGREVKTGSLGIAEESYEKSFAPYITDNEGRLLPSVKLMGNVGTEKIDIYKKTKVGVINPTGVSEVCPISALEMEGAGVPVVSKKINGIPDVIIDGRTGLLAANNKQLKKTIVKILKDDEMNSRLGKNARTFIEDNFNPIEITRCWFEVFKDIVEETDAKFIRPNCNYTNNIKWLRILSMYAHQIPLISKFPTVIDVEDFVSRRLREYGSEK